MAIKKKLRGLHGWIRLLEGSQAAALAGLIKELDRVTLSEDSSALELSTLILKDASLTSHIIRIGNSIQFNPSANSVTTVSRAIINIGFKHIRSVCMGVKVMDLLLSDSASDAVIKRLADTMHEAHQTRWLCAQYSVTEQEEAFIASLLNNLVELLVLASDTPEAGILSKRYKTVVTKKDRNDLAEEIMGVRLDALSKTLLKRWRIDGLVMQIYDPGACDDRLRSIALGSEICGALDQGLGTQAFKSVLKTTVKFTGMTGVDVKRKIKQGQADAVTALHEFGDPRLVKSIQPEADIQQIDDVEAIGPPGEKGGKTSADKDSVSADSSAHAGAAKSRSKVPTHDVQKNGATPKDGDEKGDALKSGAATDVTSIDVPKTNPKGLDSVGGVKGGDDNGSKALAPKSSVPAESSPQVLLDTLHSMTEMILGDLQINAFFKLLLIGLEQGAGFRRCAFLLYDAAGERFVIKLTRGEGVNAWSDTLELTYNNGSSAILDSLFEQGNYLLTQAENKSRQVWSELEDVSKATSYVVAPLSANGKRVGLVYADMGVDDVDMSQDAVKGFDQLIMQAKLALATIATKKK